MTLFLCYKIPLFLFGFCPFLQVVAPDVVDGVLGAGAVGGDAGTIVSGMSPWADRNSSLFDSYPHPSCTTDG